MTSEQGISVVAARRLVPAGLLVLSVVPVVAGAMRVTELSSGAEITPDNARFFATPLPVVVHICAVTVYAILGAFQFAPGLRRRRPGWHRWAGRLLVPSGLAGALAGLWMTLFYPRPGNVGDLLTGFRLVFGSAWILFLVLGFAAILRRDVSRHRAWMIRAYAVAMGAGTQVFTNLAWVLAAGTPGRLGNTIVMFAGWAINLAVAEWAIRRTPVPSVKEIR
ncbi:DUF2306 domain-containing protein [Amycolatopsis sp. GM8]|uniref:DUF2306 domain-containing protein n=1 Tax=Amycolatopsis sp. GM8 TaxID=2896530 RepID=UPI001F2C61F1|nr:DUF2306 domain-containing protein [Amycolatopsis sp. GM8]